MVELARKVLKNSIFNSLRALISGIGGFVFSVVLARLLTPEQFGIYALAMSVCFLLIQLDPGVGQTLVRYISYTTGIRDYNTMRSYFRFLLKIRILSMLFYSLLLVVLSKPLAFYVFYKPHVFLPLLILSTFIITFHLMGFFVYDCFTAFQDFKYVSIGEFIYQVFRFIFAIIPILLGIYYGIFIGLSLAPLVTLIIMLPILYRRHSILFKGIATKIETKRVLRFIGFLSLGSISGVVLTYVDTIMLGIFLPVEYVGYYRVATNIVLAIVGMISIASVVFPIFTQLEGENLENVLKKLFKFIFILSLPISISLMYFSEYIIKVIYGASYLPASSVLKVLSLLVVLGPLDLFGALFKAKEKPEYSTAISTGSMLLDIVLNYFLILRIGIVGAAIATVVSRVLSMLISYIISIKIIKLNIKLDEIIYKPLVAGLSMIIFLYVFPDFENIFIYLFKFLFSILIYLGILLLLKGIDSEDLKYIKAVIGI